MQKLNIIKIGGNVIDDPSQFTDFIRDFAALPGLKILVHGGGKLASALSESLGIIPQMVEGRRITDAETLKVVTMVYAGLINKNIVSMLQSYQCNAIGLSGADADLIRADKRSVTDIDFGFAGDLKHDSIATETISAFLNSGLVPVFSPVTHDGNGQLLNTNADTIAAALAVALSSIYDINLVYCFEKNGVLADAENDRSVIGQISFPEYTELKKSGVITGGMIPKLDNAFKAIRNGANKVRIMHASDIHSIGGELTRGTLLYA